MKRTAIVATLFGVAGGLVIGQLALQPAAVAQAPEKGPKWEYKVVSFQGSGDRNSVEGITKGFNELAGDGWEYVGPVGGYSKTYANGTADAIGLVAFRRPKK